MLRRRVTDRAVIDASAAVDVLLRNARCRRVEQALADFDLIAPAHIDVEVLSALHRHVRAGADTMLEMTSRLALWQSWPITRVALPTLLRGAASLANSVRIPDTFYIELAEQYAVPLITCDRGMAASSARAILVT